MKYIKSFLIYICLLFPLTGIAQKKQLQTVRDQLKSGKELTKAENTLRGLLVDSVSKKNNKIWLLLCDALTKQYEQGNEKLYLKQKYDTAAFFSVTRRLYDAMSRFDSLDAKPDAEGRVRAKYRTKHAEFLNSIRPNLFNVVLTLFIRKTIIPHLIIIAITWSLQIILFLKVMTI